MDQNLSEIIIKNLSDLKNALEPKVAAKLNIGQSERMIKKLAELAEACEDCRTNLVNWDVQITQLKTGMGHGKLAETEVKAYRKLVKDTLAHLEKKHKIVTENYYLTLYMSLGISLGLPFGMLFDNIALGIPIGIGIGLAIGAGMDEDARKKGLVI